jgi:hypothetical protein
VCSWGAMFVVVAAGIGGRPMKFDGTGLGVVVREPGTWSICTEVTGVSCGKPPETCDFASFFSSFCAPVTCERV